VDVVVGDSAADGRLGGGELADALAVVEPRRHLIREAMWVDRDAILADLFAKLQHVA
jgi:hypothetical protein